MNQASNLNLELLFKRSAAFLLYFTAAGFSGIICAVIFRAFLQAAFRQSTMALEIILYIISLLVTCAVLCFFSMREGYADTENLRFSALKTGLCYLAAGALFFALLVIIDAGAEANAFLRGFRAYFLQSYLAGANISRFAGDPEPSGYFLAGVLVLLNAAAITGAYKAGRMYWIARKKKRVDELRAKRTRITKKI